MQISILGCGWLGLPLAKHFITKNYSVKGSTTTAAKYELLSKEGIEPSVFTLGTQESQKIYTEFLSGSDVIVINFPPKRIPNIVAVYQEQIKAILPYIQAHQKIVFISSTSVYQNTNDWVTETLTVQPEKESGKAILAVEHILKVHLQDRLTIIRFAGLMGEDRKPGHFFAGKKELSNGAAPINMIHQLDCIRLIDAVITQDCWGELINGCADEHPTREVFYTKAAKNQGLVPPTFTQGGDLNFKQIANTKSKELLNFTYKHPDPLALV